MRKTLQWLLMVLTLIATVAFVSARQDRPGPTIARWEYRVWRIADPVTQDANPQVVGELTRVGREGWELVGVTRRQIQVQAELQTETIFYFKRAIIQ